MEDHLRADSVGRVNVHDHKEVFPPLRHCGLLGLQGLGIRIAWTVGPRGQTARTELEPHGDAKKVVRWGRGE